MLYLPAGSGATLLGMAERRAFHLEVEDDHSVSNEDEPMRRWRAGLPPLDPDNYPPDWKRWEDLTDAATGRGVALQRVRVVSEPLTEYIRFLHAVTDRNQAHGEEIRWMPRQNLDSAEVTADEWWLLDDAALAWTLFDQQGDFAGFAVTRDPFDVTRAMTVRDILWAKAIPHTDYIPGPQ
ncbi:MAG: hypothetical protein JWN03_3377 [Nocardia sp.]|uniref:DUF6879 family protein n=1 Tax=Nocardia sp. TaxID=1821 RepID=UPI002609A4A6|nr:DUF6879 family protein [Nocardia sp.]MCU1643102.1 hypothetical protein [Nocardia sp.]